MHTEARHENPAGETLSVSTSLSDPKLSGQPERRPHVKEGKYALGDLEPALGVLGEVAASKRRLVWMQRFKERDWH